MRHFLLAVIFVISAIIPSYAQDAGLYEAPPSPDAAFVRLVNVNGSSEPLKINGKIYMAAANGQATPYFVVGKGDSFIQVGDRDMTLSLNAQKYYTVVDSHSNLQSIEDSMTLNRAKALISLYNFGIDDAVTLKASDGKVAIAGPVDYGRESSRQINEVKIGMGVYQNEQKIADVGEWSLSRNHEYTVLLFKDSAGNMTTSFIEAQVKLKK